MSILVNNYTDLICHKTYRNFKFGLLKKNVDTRHYMTMNDS